MDVPGIGSTSSRVDRVETGTGAVHERTVEFGDTVLAIANIGTMTIVGLQRDARPAGLGALIAFLGVLLLKLGAEAVLVILAGLALLVWALTRKPDVFLSIGTCDGYRLQLVSKNRAFLGEIRTLLRRKIDHHDLSTAIVNISAGTISGGVAIGAQARAAGAAGVMTGDRHGR